jgi:hypothetical protein
VYGIYKWIFKIAKGPEIWHGNWKIVKLN